MQAEECLLRFLSNDRFYEPFYAVPAMSKIQELLVVAPCVRAAIQTAHLAGNVRRLFKEALESALVEAGTPHRPDRALST